MRWKFWHKKQLATEVAAAIEKEKDYLFTSADIDPISAEISKARAELIDKRTFQRAAPVVIGTAMDSCEGGVSMATAAYANVNPVALSYFAATSSFIGYEAMAVIGQNWLVQRGCSMDVKDAVKKGYEVASSDGTKLSPDDIKQIEQWDIDYKLKPNMIEAETFNGVFGIRHILFKHTNPDFDYSKPFNPDSWGVDEYAGISQIDPIYISPEFDSEDLSDPTRIGFYEPTYWYINGKRYHKSHFVVLRGDPVSDVLKPTYRYGGVSKTQKVYERLYSAERTANESPQLAMTKRMIWKKMNLTKEQANMSGVMKIMQAQAEHMNNYSQSILGKEDEIGNLDTSLADLDNIIKGQYEIVCSIFGKPVTKMMGTSAGGFATGEVDEDYGIAAIEELQGNSLTLIANAHYDRLIPTKIKPMLNVEPKIELNWLPLKVMSEKEKAEINLLRAQADLTLVQTGAIDEQDVAKRLMSDDDSKYNSIELPEMTDYEEETENW